MNDHIIRATAANHKIRVFAATTRDMTEEMRARHNSSPIITAALGRLLTASAMMGVMLKREDERITLKIEGDGPVGALIAQSDSHANVRGYAHNPYVMLPPNEKGKLDVAGAIGRGLLHVTRSSSSGEPFTGSCELVSGEIAEDLTYYYALSEQTPSSVALGVLMNRDNTVRASGGFIIQLLPGVEDGLIETLEESLLSLPPVTTLLGEGLDAEGLVRRVLCGFEVTVHERYPVRFHCGCNRESVERVLLSLGYDELQTLADRPVEVHCDYCNSNYEYSIQEINKLLKEISP